MRTVLVVGGGYAGCSVAQALDGVAEVTLLDPRDAFVNVSASMRALVRADWADRPFFDYRTLLTRGRIVRDQAVSADPRGVTLATGKRIDADILVLATGSTHAYPARPRTSSTDAGRAAAELRATGEHLSRAGRVLIMGAGPVGLELAGEIRAAWPDKPITIVGRSADVLPGFLPEVRGELRRQLDALGIDLRLNTVLQALPTVQDGIAETITVSTTSGESLTADIWFRCFGGRPNTQFLDSGALVALTSQGTVPVDGHLNVVGHSHVYALGDIAALPDAKMATWAQTQAVTVSENILAQLQGKPAAAVYETGFPPRILLPLGDRFGVGQLPSPAGGVLAASVPEVIERKGADLFTERFASRFNAVPGTPHSNPAGG